MKKLILMLFILSVFFNLAYAYDFKYDAYKAGFKVTQKYEKEIRRLFDIETRKILSIKDDKERLNTLLLALNDDYYSEPTRKDKKNPFSVSVSSNITSFKGYSTGKRKQRFWNSFILGTLQTTFGIWGLKQKSSYGTITGIMFSIGGIPELVKAINVLLED